MPDHRAGDRGGDLEAEELLADVVGAMSARCAPPDGRPAPSAASSSSCAVVFGRGAQIDEEAVVAVDGGVAERLAVDRDQALAVLAGRLGDQLLDPGAEIGDARARRGSSPCRGPRSPASAQREAELHAGIFGRRHVGAAGAHHRQRCDRGSARRRCRRPRPAPGRTATAPNSARRSSGSPWKMCAEALAAWRPSPATSRDR